MTCADMPDLVVADVALFGVEQQIADIRIERAKIPERATAEEEAADEQLFDQAYDLDEMVKKAPVQTMAGAACVLRRLLDPSWGVGNTSTHRTDDLHCDIRAAQTRH